MIDCELFVMQRRNPLDSRHTVGLQYDSDSDQENTMPDPSDCHYAFNDLQTIMKRYEKCIVKEKKKKLELQSTNDYLQERIKFYAEEKICLNNALNEQKNQNEIMQAQIKSLNEKAAITEKTLERLHKVLDAMDHADILDKFQCVVCMDLQREVVFLDCGHVCCCSDCAGKLAVPAKCPICRAKIRDFKHVLYV